MSTDVPRVQIVGLYQGSGTHYVNLYCGSNAQKQSMIVDTGSSATAMACAPDCSPRQCGRLHHALYHPGQSDTFSKVTTCADCVLGECQEARNGGMECVWDTSYQEGSNWTAYEAMDRCSLAPSVHPPLDEAPGTDVVDTGRYREARDASWDLRFGCQTHLSGQFRSQTTAGIMGLDRSETALWNQMYNQGKIPLPVFTLCLARAVDEKSFAGAMTLGGRFPTHRPMAFAAMHPDDSNSEFFAVQLRRLYLRFNNNSVGRGVSKNAQTIPIERSSDPYFYKRRIVIDSGTTDTFFVQELEEPFRQAWLEILGMHYSNDPIALSVEALNSLPTVILQLKGDDDSNEKVLHNDPSSPNLAVNLDPDRPMDVLVAVPPTHYMEYQEDLDMYVSGIYFEEAEGSVIGSNVMLLHDVYFDEEHKRIGWVESSCDYAQLVDPLVPVSPPRNDWKMGPIQVNVCTSSICRRSVLSCLILSILVVVSMAFHRGKLRRRRQRRLWTSPHTSRMVQRSVSRSISSSITRAPSLSSSTIMAFLVPPGTRHPSVSVHSDPLHIPLGGSVDGSHVAEFQRMRRGNLLRSRSRDGTL